MLRASIASQRRVLRSVIGASNHFSGSPITRSYCPTELPLRTFCDEQNSRHGKGVADKQPPGMLSRILKADDSGKNPILRVLGYYSSESRAIGVGNSLYEQALSRAEATKLAEMGETSEFSATFEMLSLHVYLTLTRLRLEKGSPYEGDVKTVMQCLFDVFWTDVRKRMMIKDHKLSLITSGKWIKECEQKFFGMAMAFDEAWDDEEEMKACISRNVTCLNGDEKKVNSVYKYMRRERERLDNTTIEQVWDGVCWDAKGTSTQTA